MLVRVKSGDSENSWRTYVIRKHGHLFVKFGLTVGGMVSCKSIVTGEVLYLWPEEYEEAGADDAG